MVTEHLTTGQTRRRDQPQENVTKKNKRYVVSTCVLFPDFLHNIPVVKPLYSFKTNPKNIFDNDPWKTLGFGTIRTIFITGCLFWGRECALLFQSQMVNLP